jgi:hypothetical protein
MKSVCGHSDINYDEKCQNHLTHEFGIFVGMKSGCLEGRFRYYINTLEEMDENNE